MPGSRRRVADRRRRPIDTPILSGILTKQHDRSDEAWQSPISWRHHQRPPRGRRLPFLASARPAPSAPVPEPPKPTHTTSTGRRRGVMGFEDENDNDSRTEEMALTQQTRRSNEPPPTVGRQRHVRLSVRYVPPSEMCDEVRSECDGRVLPSAMV